MKRLFFPLFIFGILLCSAHFAFCQSAHAPNQLMIRVKSEFAPAFPFPEGELELGLAALDRLNAQNELIHLRCLGRGKPRNPAIPRPADRTYLLTFARALDIPALADFYMTTGLLEFAEPNYAGKGAGVEGTNLIPNEALFSNQWGLSNDGSFSLSPAVADADVDMDQAWDVTTGNSSVVAAILDTGTRLGHPEFSGRLWVNTLETPGNGTDDDNNGYGDDINGWDFANGDATATDDNGHGTNVTGILGATGNNGIGYAGVDWNCKLMVLKVLDNTNYGFYSWWTDAFYYAVGNGASVVNISAGGTSFSTFMLDAVEYAYANDVAIVASMMNEDTSRLFYPAAYSQTIAVGATDPNDHRSSPFPWSTTSGSNFGTHIDVVAPGSYIFGLNYQSNTNYNTYWSGTSQAAPLVTGICALMRGTVPGLSVDDLRNILRNTADDQVGDPAEDVAGFDNYYGYGRVNAQAALAYAVSREKPLPESAGIQLIPNPARDQVLIRYTEHPGEMCVVTLLDTKCKALTNK